MKKILVAFGTRPEAIKLAPVIHVLRKCADVELTTCVTGQHRQMLDQVLEWFGIVPDYDLNVMQAGQTLSGLTARILTGISDVLETVRPDIVLVQGDTTTGMVASLAAFYYQIPVGHIEAGLRTHDLYDPFPEEANRLLISMLARYHFAPTERARQELLSEGKAASSIYLTGNTAIDALYWTLGQPYNPQEDLAACQDANQRVILVTQHRRESFGSGLREVCFAIKEIVNRYSDVSVVFPVHLNPNVQGPVMDILGGIDRVHLIRPLPYPDLIHLMKQSWIIITDSGGIQEEAPALGKPVLVTRHNTERTEALSSGTAVLVGTDIECILSVVDSLHRDESVYETMAKNVLPFGDGHASERIAHALVPSFDFTQEPANANPPPRNRDLMAESSVVGATAQRTA